jgi:hypothetical protein
MSKIAEAHGIGDGPPVLAPSRNRSQPLERGLPDSARPFRQFESLLAHVLWRRHQIGPQSPRRASRCLVSTTTSMIIPDGSIGPCSQRERERSRMGTHRDCRPLTLALSPWERETRGGHSIRPPGEAAMPPKAAGSPARGAGTGCRDAASRGQRGVPARAALPGRCRRNLGA